MSSKNLKSRIYRLGSKRAFTLVEFLIVVAILAILAVATLILFNPMQQINKAIDGRRKTELTQLNKVFEDYYNDKGCYPKPADVCYDAPINICTGVGGQNLDSQTCHICGSKSGSPSFPYISTLPCDPQENNQKEYLYQVSVLSGLSCPTSITNAADPCPQWYRVYSHLGVQSDSSISELGCTGGACGVAPDYGYDYGVASPNQQLNRNN